MTASRWVVVVVVVVVALDLALATAARVELGDCSFARWEYLSLLFRRFQIPPLHACERFLPLSLAVPQLLWSQADPAALWRFFLMFLTYAFPQDFKFPSFCQARLLARGGEATTARSICSDPALRPRYSRALS